MTQSGYGDELAAMMLARASDRIVISGCSGGGKSSLIAALARKGYSTFDEPGRQVVREQMLIGGRGLPWEDLGQFVELTVSRSLLFAFDSLKRKGPSFFDRSPVDQVSALEASGAAVPGHLLRVLQRLTYNRRVFLVPPWREIYVHDAERRHDFDEAEAAYHRLAATYRRLGYDIVILPRVDVEERVHHLLGMIPLRHQH